MATGCPAPFPQWAFLGAGKGRPVKKGNGYAIHRADGILFLSAPSFENGLLCRQKPCFYWDLLKSDGDEGERDVGTILYRNYETGEFSKRKYIDGNI